MPYTLTLEVVALVPYFRTNIHGYPDHERQKCEALCGVSETCPCRVAVKAIILKFVGDGEAD